MSIIKRLLRILIELISTSPFLKKVVLKTLDNKLGEKLLNKVKLMFSSEVEVERAYMDPEAYKIYKKMKCLRRGCK
ncbi:hypothetical protein L3Q72_00860 [Vibrio sp. JC009]|uniref:hypothetical protein n=1 Tax=Vibrio sp. JC009 TaxID=2912314 RepID=UPI0023B106C0|nr:hypothetical protein [Vibrio sp. JC009]WED21998.1 hypothetical protein L3Q72_00860 [Vibrio sp. JC009]